jgi:hypothetical protein
MKVSVLTLFSVVAAASAAMAAPVGSSADVSGLMKYIVIFEKGLDTPDRVVKAAEKRLKEIGAYITYEYNTVVKGFAVSAPADVIATFAKDDNDPLYPFIVEVDKEVSTNR